VVRKQWNVNYFKTFSNSVPHSLHKKVFKPGSDMEATSIGDQYTQPHLGHLNIGGLEEPKQAFLLLTFIPSGLVMIIFLKLCVIRLLSDIKPKNYSLEKG
jgi:hypothetical protein